MSAFGFRGNEITPSRRAAGIFLTPGGEVRPAASSSIRAINGRGDAAASSPLRTVSSSRLTATTHRRGAANAVVGVDARDHTERMSTNALPDTASSVAAVDLVPRETATSPFQGYLLDVDESLRQSILRRCYFHSMSFSTASTKLM